MFQDNGSQKADGDVLDSVPEVQETVQVIPGSKLLWRVNTRPPNSAQVRTPPASPGLSVPPTPGPAPQLFLRPLSQERGPVSLGWTVLQRESVGAPGPPGAPAEAWPWPDLPAAKAALCQHVVWA